MNELITVIFTVVGVYVSIGVLFAIAFVIKGVNRIDPNATGAGAGFRLLILPGAATFWPLLLKRWLSGSPPPDERNAHRDAAVESRT